MVANGEHLCDGEHPETDLENSDEQQRQQVRQIHDGCAEEHEHRGVAEAGPYGRGACPAEIGEVAAKETGLCHMNPDV